MNQFTNKDPLQKRKRLALSLFLLFVMVFAGMLAVQKRHLVFKESPSRVAISPVFKQQTVLPDDDSGMEETPEEVGGIQLGAEALEIGNQFNVWLNFYVAAPKAKQAELEAEGVRLAVARKAVMLDLIETDPEQAIKRAISVVKRRTLPASIREHVEDHISEEGELTTMIATKFGENPKSTVTRHVQFGETTYRTFTYGKRNDRRFDNKRIPLNGIVLDGKFALNESPLRVIEPGEFQPAELEAAGKNASCPISKQATERKKRAVPVLVGKKIAIMCHGGHIAAYGNELLAQAIARDPAISNSEWTLGAKTILYISIIFKDQSGSPVKTDMNAVNAFFQANSYNKYSLTTTFTPTYQMSKNASEYTSAEEIINESRALAAADGYVYTNYTLETIRWDGGYGDFGGAAGLGGRNSLLKTANGGVAAHELGHCLGLMHANFWKTVDGTSLGEGSNEEYGDIFDVMGNAYTFPQTHYNAWEKNYLNWLPTINSTEVINSGTYRIHAHDMNTMLENNKYALIYRKDGNRVFWLDYRQHEGWSSSQTNILNSVSLLWAPWASSNEGTQLIDTTPNSSGGKNDAPIALGRTFSDAEAQVHFTIAERGGTSPNLWADVVVNVGAFPANAAPTLSLTASSTTVQANTVVNFEATASDSNGDTLAYHWDFGDNTFGANASTASKSWTANGSRRVTCTVSDMKGGTATQIIYVNVVNSGTYAITGNIMSSGGVPQAGVAVSDGTRSVVTDSLGYYALLNVPNGAYTLTPSLIGMSFSPATRTNVSVANASVTGMNFTAITLPVPANGPGVGVTREWWTGITGWLVSHLTANAAYPNSPTGTETVTTLFEAPINWGDNYGQRMHGYFIAPSTGNYVFYIASDDQCQLWLSTDATTANAVNIAWADGWTSSREWNKYPSQKSVAKALVAGQRYYIRALHKENNGGDNLAVGVEYPNGSIERPIPFHRFDPWPSVSWVTASQASFDESGTLTVTAQLSSVSPQPVTVPFTISGTAATGIDYTISASPITITAGTMTASVTIAIAPDTTHELGGETVILNMGTPTNAAQGDTPVHTATITDDDNIAPVVYAGADYSVALSSGTAWSPSQLTPEVWLDATRATINSGTVSIVNLGSGGGTFSGPAALTANGISTRQTVTFTGGTQKLTGTYTNTGATLNAFFVGKSSTSINQNSWTGMMSVWQTSMNWDYNNSGSAVLFGQNGSTQNSIYTQREAALSSTSGTLTNAFLASTVFDGLKNTIFLDGTAATSFPSSGNFNAGKMVLCNRWDRGASSNGWKGTFGEAIICNANLSASDRQKVEGYLAHRWGMAASLAATHPHQTNSPMVLTLNLDGTVNDPDGDPLTTTWELVSGPASVTIANASSVDTTATVSTTGTYIFRLTANDSYGPITDDVVIKVDPTGLNSVVYHGNGSTGGNEPVDTGFYANGATVTVLGNTGGLVKTGCNFTGWNTAANGSGTARAPGSTFPIGTARVTLYAQWAFATPYDEWFSKANLGSWMNASFTGDTNNDGMANGLSWLLGAAGPEQHGSSFLPQAVQSSGNLSLSFKMLKSTKRAAAILAVQFSRDLGVSDAWTSHTITVPDVTSTVSGVSFVVTPIAGTDHNQVQATIPASAAGGSGKIFARMSGKPQP